MANKLRRPRRISVLACSQSRAGKRGRLPYGFTAALVCLALAASAAAQTPALHFQHPVGMPPGFVGTQQLGRGGPVPGYFQPVEIMAPGGAMIALAEGGAIGEPQKSPVEVGLLVGQVYRICVLNIPFRAGMEVFPTIEVVDRLYPPPGQETRFPIKIELTQEDLQLALDGKFVTRVIYLEDPEKALPVASAGKGQSWFEVAPGKDPLIVADLLGRPVAIVRMGGRVPDQGIDAGFLFGSPPLVKFAARPQIPPTVATRPPAPPKTAKVPR